VKKLKEAAPAEIAAIKRRTIRSYAMGDISESDCAAVTKALGDLELLIGSIKEIKIKKGA
jgi:hypothetical protein